ncbi:MAG: redox-sensitive transcriptional activator SoxR [Pseudomonadota bacterium]
MKKDPFITIGAMAVRTGTNVSAIRFYADEGIIPSIRNAGGHRLFHRSVLRRVSFILIAQKLGYTLTQIRAALDSLPDSRTPTKADWDRLSRSFSKDIDQKIQQLQQLKESLSGCIGCGCLSLQRCRLYNPDDQIAKRGAGARYLLGDSYSDLNQ